MGTCNSPPLPYLNEDGQTNGDTLVAWYFKLKYIFYRWTRQRIHNILIVVDRHLPLMRDKTIPDSSEDPRLQSFYPPFVARIDRWIYIDGILPKRPYLPCASMAGRALLAGYHRYVVRCLKALALSSKVFNETILLWLNNSLILAYLSYYIHVWGKAYDTHLKHVLVLQNTAEQVIAGAPPRTNVDNLYSERDILPVKEVFVYIIDILMYKYIYINV